MHSPEGIPWKEYKFGPLLLMAPFGVPIGFYLELVWRLSRNRAHLVGGDNLPNDAIMYNFHVDVATNFVTMQLLRQINKKVLFSGFHGFLSYSSFGPGCMGAYDVWRYDRKRGVKPFDQIVAMLKDRPDRILGIFTDSGGPYFKVRDSLARLALATNRPLVPYRSLYHPILFQLSGQNIPAPCVSGKSLIGAPIYPEELAAIAPDKRQDFLEMKLRAVSDEGFPSIT